MFSTDFIFRQQENLVDNQKCQAGFRPLCNKILFLHPWKSHAHRGVVPGGAMAPPDFGKSVSPISTKGGRLCPPNNTGTPGFSDLPTSLKMAEVIQLLGY